MRSLTYSGNSRSGSISLDRRFLAFASNRDGKPRIWLEQLASGEEVALTAGPDGEPRISPDSSTILFGRSIDVVGATDAAGAGARERVDLYRVPIVGGEARRLVRGIASADWSPDGRQIVCARNQTVRSQLFVIPADGGEERLLLDQPGLIRTLSWADDGRILFVTRPSINALSALTVAAVDVASRAHRILYRPPAGSVVNSVRGDGDAVLLAWSPSQAQRGEALLERLAPGETSPRPVFSFTTLPLRFELVGPGEILYDDAGRHRNLFEVGSDGAIGRPLTGGRALDRQPAFSADGKQVVFSSDRSGSLDLWSTDLVTGAVRRLTFDPSDEWDPHWSPDGKHLLWSSNRGGHFEVWMADADGGAARQVTHDGVDAENPTMTGDGAWIVYASGNPAAPGIWRVHPDGSGRALLSGTLALPDTAAATGWVAALGVRSDGTMIHIVRVADGTPVAEIPVRSRPGSTRVRWLADGHTLVYTDLDANGRLALFRQEIVPGKDNRGERQLVARGDDRHDIDTFGVSPADGRIVVAAGWDEGDVLLAEGIAGIGEALRSKARR